MCPRVKPVRHKQGVPGVRMRTCVFSLLHLRVLALPVSPTPRSARPNPLAVPSQAAQLAALCLAAGGWAVIAHLTLPRVMPHPVARRLAMFNSHAMVKIAPLVLPLRTAAG